MNTCALPTEGKTTTVTLLITLALLIGLPLLGAFTAGLPLNRYLEFPPLTRYITPAAFSWPVFLSMAVFVLVVVGPILYRILISSSSTKDVPLQTRPFPWWGWLGVIWLAGAWLLAWNRFDWFEPLQRHTFTPLWLGYIVVANALTFKRSAECLLLNRTTHLVALFITSALFWWYFEFLNRFVQNWHYIGIGTFTPGEYALFGTLSFSTVLPAVVSTRDLLATFPRLTHGMESYIKLRLPNPCRLASIALIVSAIALANIGRWPDYLFPMLWLAPLMVLVSVQTLRGEAHVLQRLANGNWRSIWLAALAALVCGFFWELWNWNSLAKWQYAVPFVHRFQVFEMPLLGYTGYLPFGIECIAIAEVLRRKA
ncbi:MAG: hypothetical protein LJE56_04175 [Acidiferrobacterales bacterium]|jgi:hypothetical protein|nr:hypothetical protein [Acidiferrobacterales bacterium]